MSDIDIGRIYEIVCPLDPDWRYVGATFMKLNGRLSCHRADFRLWEQGKIKKGCSCFQHFALFGVENHSIRLIKEYPVVRLGPQDHRHLSVYETLWQRKLKCCNKITPCNPLKAIEHRERQRERRKDPVLREKVKTRERERLKDPEYREKVKAQNRERKRERMKDPVLREKRNARERERRARKKAEAAAAIQGN